MKKTISLFAAMLLTCFLLQAQTGKTTRTNAGSKRVTKKAETAKYDPWRLDFYTVKDDSGMTILSIKNGDKLVYHVTKDSQQYDLIITYKKYSMDQGIEFTYELTDDKYRTGNVKVTPQANKITDMYVNYFLGGNMDLTETSALWLSNRTVGELLQSQSDISFDYSQAETFHRDDTNNDIPLINYKGTMYKLDAYCIDNSKAATEKKTLWIHHSSLNPLILKMDIGWTIELKEIR